MRPAAPHLRVHLVSTHPSVSSQQLHVYLELRPGQVPPSPCAQLLCPDPDKVGDAESCIRPRAHMAATAEPAAFVAAEPYLALASAAGHDGM